MDGGYIVGVPYFELFCNDLEPRQRIAARDVAWYVAHLSKLLPFRPGYH